MAMKFGPQVSIYFLLSCSNEISHIIAAAQGPLSEVLEVPALMDTCVRNGHFDEALDLRVC